MSAVGDVPDSSVDSKPVSGIGGGLWGLGAESCLLPQPVCCLGSETDHCHPNMQPWAHLPPSRRLLLVAWKDV